MSRERPTSAFTIFIRPARIVVVNPASARPVATLVAVRALRLKVPFVSRPSRRPLSSAYRRLPESSIEEALI